MSSANTAGADIAAPRWATAALVLGDGSVFWGKGVGASKAGVGEVCFNTSMTGYQEIITDPSYAGQIITFTFPHIGNVGTNAEDIESINPAARGVVLRGDITEPANWRAAKPLDDWLKGHNLPGVCGVDTRESRLRVCVKYSAASVTNARPTVALQSASISARMFGEASVAARAEVVIVTTRAKCRRATGRALSSCE